MKHFLIALMVSFALLVSSMAAATCNDADCLSVSQFEKQTDAGAKALHACACQHHVPAAFTLAFSMHAPVATASGNVASLSPTLHSITVHPLLEPPSHA